MKIMLFYLINRKKKKKVNIFLIKKNKKIYLKIMEELNLKNL